METGSVFQSFRKGGSVKPDRLSEGSVADIVKRYAKAAGLDPEAISGHSLRAGFGLKAARDGGYVVCSDTSWGELPGIIFAGSLDECLGYMRSKCEPSAEKAKA